ncbi:cell wall hydrolase [Paenibacillus caui]|uniref:cell wall hydrolase n=1 Tax=Paenibacillus caui TaxID=2873927 RepID=UPI001CA86B45|nr:cell wall hydrolase [Paenibacillus caui]
MELLKQHRYVMLLISTIFICIGGFFLLWNMLRNVHYQSAGFPHLTAASHKYEEIPARAPDIGPIKQRSRSIPFTLQEKLAQHMQLAIDSKQAKAKPKRQIKTAAQAAANRVAPPVKIFFTRTALLRPEYKDKATRVYEVSKEELLLLQKIVMAEAEGEPYEGKVAVANVVLNRLRSANYPDTIYDVIYQKHQFSPVANGRLKRIKPNADSVKAVAETLKGRKEVSDDTYYFLSLKLATDLSVHRSQKQSKKIGNHTFYK